jgi:hypothetical protein
MKLDMSKALDWAATKDDAQAKASEWMSQLESMGLQDSHTIAVRPYRPQKGHYLQFAIFVVPKTAEKTPMTNAVAETPQAILCAGGCGRSLTPAEIRNKQKTKRGHGDGKCPGPSNGAPVVSPPPVKAPPTVKAAAAAEPESKPEPEAERQYRHEHVLNAIRSLHFIPELTCPAFGNGVGWHVRLEAAHMPEDEVKALKEFLGYKA